MQTEPSRHQKRIGIVGGGLSGLATAAHLHLTDSTASIRVIESAPRAGGVIHSQRVGPYLVDHGADMFALKPSAAFDLCQRLGAADQLIEPQQVGRGAQIVCDGRLVPIPDGFVLMRATKLSPMLKTPLLSPMAKLRFLLEGLIGGNVGNEDQSVADFVRTRMGKGVLQRIVGPLVAGIYTADIEKLSLLATMGPIASMVREHGSLSAATKARKREGLDSSERNSAGARYNQFRSFPGGMAQLIDLLSDTLPDGTIQTGTSVNRIERQGDGWVLHTTSQDPANNQSDQSEPFNELVLATPARVTARLLEDHAPVAANELKGIESASTAIVVLGVKKSNIQRPVETFGFVVPPGENRKILAGSFASAKFAGRAPEDHLLIRVFIGGALQSHLLDNDDETLISIARSELSDLIGLQGEPEMADVIRWNQAMPQYHVGHLQRVARIDDAVAQLPGIHMMCNALHGVGISPIIARAERTANKILSPNKSE